jgi:hypothetical protein
MFTRDHAMLRRIHPRYLTFKDAKISHEGNTLAVDCLIINVSEGGACLMIPDDTDIPDTFELSADGGKFVRTCNVAWRTKSRLGISFEITAEMRAFNAILAQEAGPHTEPSGRLPD